MSISTVGMDRTEWKRLRQFSIGASEAAAALGLSQYKSPYDVWAEKTGEVPAGDLDDIESVRIGLAAEPMIGTLYEEDTGLALEPVPAILQHPTIPYLTCNLDSRVAGEPILVEKKTAGMTSHGYIDPAWGEPGTDQTPQGYFVQAQIQLDITGFVRCDIAALLAGIGFRIFPVHPNAAVIAAIHDGLAEFWDYVQRGTPPPARTIDEVRRRFPKAKPLAIEATEEVAHAVAMLREAKAQAKAIAATEDAAQDVIAAYLAEHDTLNIGGKPAVTFKTQTARRIDIDSLRAAHPAMCEQFTRESTTRVMRVKAK